MKKMVLPSETWREAAERIALAAPYVANYLRKINHDGSGEQDYDDFMIDMQLAYTAMRYVAEFANDKCVIVAEPDGGARK